MQQSISSQNQESHSQPEGTSVKRFSTRPRFFHLLLIALKILVGLVLLVLSFREVRLSNLLTGIRFASPTWLGLAILSVLIGLGLKLWRWIILVKYFHIKTRFSRLFSAYFLGQAANIILPFRGGELVRLGYLVEDKHILSEAATTILLEKYLDLIALTISVLVVSFNISLENIPDIQKLLLPISIIVSLLLLAAIILGPSISAWLINHKFLTPRINIWLNHWVQASQWLRNPLQVLPGIILTVIIWGIMWLTNLLLFKSMGISLGGTAGGLVLVLTYFGLLPALMPGNIGPFYFFATLALLPYGILHQQAIAFAVVLHAIVTLPPLVGGAIGLFIRTPRPLVT